MEAIVDIDTWTVTNLQTWNIFQHKFCRHVIDISVDFIFQIAGLSAKK